MTVRTCAFCLSHSAVLRWSQISQAYQCVETMACIARERELQRLAAIPQPASVAELLYGTQHENSDSLGQQKPKT